MLFMKVLEERYLTSALMRKLNNIQLYQSHESVQVFVAILISKDTA